MLSQTPLQPVRCALYNSMVTRWSVQLAGAAQCQRQQASQDMANRIAMINRFFVLIELEFRSMQTQSMLKIHEGQ